MNVELSRAELIRLEKYLADEKKEHPGIWRALIEGIKSRAAKVIYEVNKKELGLLKKVLKIKNPISARTKSLRESGAIKENEWLGGNEFYHRKPKETFFERAEKYGGQIRMELNPKKKKARKKSAKGKSIKVVAKTRQPVKKKKTARKRAA